MISSDVIAMLSWRKEKALNAYRTRRQQFDWKSCRESHVSLVPSGVIIENGNDMTA